MHGRSPGLRVAACSAGLPSDDSPVAVLRGWLAAYSCGVSSGFASRRTGFPLEPDYSVGDREPLYLVRHQVDLSISCVHVGEAVATSSHQRRFTIHRLRLNDTRSSHAIGQRGCGVSRRASAFVAIAPSIGSGSGCL